MRAGSRDSLPDLFRPTIRVPLRATHEFLIDIPIGQQPAIER